MRRHDTVSFLSDYGLVDEFVGVCRSVVREIAPHAAVVDLTHQIPRFDVRAGGLALARAVQYVAPGVVLAVVDPGVGTDRRAVAVEVAEGAGVLVGPDNGLLAPAVALVGGAERAVHLTNDEYHLDTPGATFDGRDVFAPVAAHLCNGVDLEEFGEPIDPALMTPGLVPVPQFENEQIVAEVLWVDHYGNAQLNVDAEVVAELGDPLVVVMGDERRTMKLASSFAELSDGSYGLVTDSYGLLAICANRTSAAAELGLRPGREVILAEAR